MASLKGPIEEKYADVYFRLLYKGKTTRIAGHRIPFAAQSPVFDRILFKDEESSPPLQRGPPVVDDIVLEDTNPVHFRLLMEHFYKGPEADILTGENLPFILEMAQKYEVEILIRICSTYIKSKMHPALICGLYGKSSGIMEEEAIIETCVEHTSDFVGGDDFALLPPDKFLTVVQNPELTIDEESLFEAIIRWSDAEMKRQQLLPSPESRQFVLRKALPHIRFPTMSFSFLASTVASLGILPESVLVALFTHANNPRKNKAKSDPRLSSFIMNDRRGALFRGTKLLSFRQCVTLQTWAQNINEGKSPSAATNPYFRFNLIHSGSRDGFKAKDFQEKISHGKNPIILLRSKDTLFGQIYGGQAIDSESLPGYSLPMGKIYGGHFSLEGPYGETCSGFQHQMYSDHDVPGIRTNAFELAGNLKLHSNMFLSCPGDTIERQKASWGRHDAKFYAGTKFFAVDEIEIFEWDSKRSERVKSLNDEKDNV